MQPMMELRGGSERGGSQPQGEREPGDGESAGGARSFVCKPMVHYSFTKPHFWGNARELMRRIRTMPSEMAEGWKVQMIDNQAVLSEKKDFLDA
jgi:hypothetical protein